MADLSLRPFTLADEPEALDAHAELARDGFEFLLDRDRFGSWSEWIDATHRWRQGDVPQDRVRAAFLAVDVDGQLVGRCSIRFELDEFLTERGGHVGYGIRPRYRRRGHAAEALRRSLELLHDDGIENALITCDEVNAASRAVIESCGGVFERHAVHDPTVRRYRIDLR